MAAGRCSASERFGRLKFRLAQSNEFGLIDLNCFASGRAVHQSGFGAEEPGQLQCFPHEFWYAVSPPVFDRCA